MPAERLVDLVQYQTGSIVSKEIVRGEAGTVSLFAFARRQGLSEHTAPFDALVIVIDGQAQVKIAGESFCVKAGELIIMPANKPHSLQANQDFKMLLVLIKK